MVQIQVFRIGGEKPEMSEEKAAEKIQASFRGYKTRKTLKDNGVLPAKDKNQSNGEIDEKTEELPEHPEEKSAAKPSSARPALTKEDEEDIAAIDLTDVDLEKAAAKIQASYRNFSKKKQQPPPSPPPEAKEEEKPVENDTKNDDEENLEDIDLGDPEVEKAALKIQSTFRGYKVRKEVKGEETDETPLTNGEKGEDEE